MHTLVQSWCETRTPTLATPTVEDPGGVKADDTASVITRRKYFSDQTGIVKRVRESGLRRKWAKNLRETVLGGKHEKFAGKDKDVAKLEVVESDSVAKQYFLATDCSTGRDGRRALIDLVKGCVPAGFRVSHKEESYAALCYPARVDPRPALAKELCWRKRRRRGLHTYD
ncbi:hypothetical protein CYMTET_43522 [Cymbomonas tetramitiformis]|uniref:Uncharacterized protein n=1 Tax=Cymbomonas tetramitiformis TaxID=36881 RepID=A0AAE0EZW2_9CHLO|nr:hypothetical protein CYMTET_43522 [Cymbomonas tetramitiformis]